MEATNFVVITASLVAAFLIVCGTIMVFRGITLTGTIDIKSALISGKIETGCIGLLFSFLGVVLLVFAVRTRRTVKTVFSVQEPGERQFDWSRWEESGDPATTLMDELFPAEEVPSDVKDQPVIDWISEKKITEMVDGYLEKELRRKALTFAAYHPCNDHTKCKELSETVIQIADNKFTLEPKPDVFTCGEKDLAKNQIIDDMLNMLESAVESYFTSKKKTFIRWEKDSVSYAPLHPDLADWLAKIEDTWSTRLRDLRKFLKRTDV